MQVGFGKVDITPRIGVPLCGFGPFLHRYSVGLRDRLWARALAVKQDGRRAVVVSCDLVGICRQETQRARDLVRATTGLPGEALMVHCTHTHSGPDTSPDRIGWGGYDPPYMELLPRRIATAAEQALANLDEATLSHAEVPCEGIGLNREQDRDAPPLQDVLADDWRPAKPELTDTTCHVVTAQRHGRLIGFFSYFGCHPVCCCAQTRSIHGDFVGVATNLLEREHPGVVGLFLQGAQGDVNSCVVHQPEQEALLALDVIASRYARAVRVGIASAAPLAVDCVRWVVRRVAFSRRPWTEDDVRRRLDQAETKLREHTGSDQDAEFRMNVVSAVALRRILTALIRGDSLQRATELQGLRIGPVALLGCPFEVFQAIKNEVQDRARSSIPLVMGLTNDSCGYAPDHEAAARGGYAADTVPMIHGYLPYANLHHELVEALLDLDTALVEPEAGEAVHRCLDVSS